MKKGVLFVCLMSLSFFSFAQIERKLSSVKQNDSLANKTGEFNEEENNRKKMMKELGLTREQAVKMKELHRANKEKKDAIFNNDKLTNEERKSQLRSLQKELFQNTLAILNDEQKQKLKQMRNGFRNANQNQ
jgi:Spy/CpxP family protein refolding chaperone